MRGIGGGTLPARQHGAALLALLALVGVAVIFAYVTGLNRSAADMAQARAQRTSIALAKAKEAVIAYAVTYGDTHANQVPGYLPCPEMGATPSNEGSATGSCGAALVSQIGRLPWRTLGLGSTADGSGECLWYAVSGTYKNSPNNPATSNTMNWDTNGQFAVMAADGTSYLTGSAADNLAVAVIFAPGAPVSGQNRAPDANARLCPGNYTAANYLEASATINNSAISATANAVTTFIAGTSSNTFNDQLVYITRADIWNAVKKRSDFQNSLRALTRRAAECVAMYGGNNQPGPDLTDKRLPWASPVSLANYAANVNYDDANGLLQGRMPFRVDTAKLSTNNQLSGSSPFGVTPYCWYTTQELAWYQNWKDHLFYALAGNFQPSAATPTAACGTCLKIEGAGNYAAVVVFAGENLSGVSRAIADKADIAKYLEGRNATNTGGSGDYQAATASSTFNDFVYAIDQNLAVTCYDSASLSMQPTHTTACP
jgi:hypothetical protein